MAKLKPVAVSGRGKAKVRVMRDCAFCRKPMETDPDTSNILCDTCVARLCDPPAQPKPTVVVSVEEKKARKEEREAKKKAKLEAKKTAKRGKGRGWHLKQLFEYEGKYYSFGKEITSEAAVKLRKKLKVGK